MRIIENKRKIQRQNKKKDWKVKTIVMKMVKIKNRLNFFYSASNSYSLHFIYMSGNIYFLVIFNHFFAALKYSSGMTKLMKYKYSM